jgi:predicted ATPase
VWFIAMPLVQGVAFDEFARGARAYSTGSKSNRDVSGPFGIGATKPAGKHTAAETNDVEHASPPPSFERVRAALEQLVDGVAALHDANLLHLDIKPRNVLVEDDGRVVLLDFGLVRPTGSEMRRSPRPVPSIGSNAPEQPVLDTRSAAGTPAYMSPEQMRGDRVGTAADWYAVGVTLYLALTGRLPFRASGFAGLYFEKMFASPTPPHEIVADVPRDLSDICISLLQPDPAKRATGTDVERVLAGDRAAIAQIAKRAVLAPFVGRRDELSSLASAFAAAQDGKHRIVHVRGASGMGKSAMMSTFAALVRDVDGAIVLGGRCYERERVPYNAFDGVVDELAEALRQMPRDEVDAFLPPWTAELSRVFPTLAAVDAVAARVASRAAVDEPVELRRRAHAALAVLLDRVAAARPLVLHVDDVQWADDDSAGLLLGWMLRRDALRVEANRCALVVVGYREAEAKANGALREYFAAAESAKDHVVDLPIGPLSRDEASHLATSTLREFDVEATSGIARAIADESHGVPIFVSQLARHLATRGEGTVAHVTIDALIAARVRALPENQRAIVECLAVGGNAVPQGVAIEAARLGSHAMPELIALRAAGLLRSTGLEAGDSIELQHDRIRESVIAAMAADDVIETHLRLGRAFARRFATDARESLLFEAATHLDAAGDRLVSREERLEAARLDLAAGRTAREGAAFALALQYFEAGIALLGDEIWDHEYDLALGLYVGAAEAAYLRSEWALVGARVETVKRNARSVLDAVPAWEAEIDAFIARNAYAASVECALDGLSRLGVQLPRDPGMAEVRAAVERASNALARVGVSGLEELGSLDDRAALAVMRIETRVSSAAYFAAPLLFPILACDLIVASVQRGLSPATPYALAVYGIVLNTVGAHEEAHRWGQVALPLIERWSDRRLEARTRHIVHDLVCVWVVPLASTLADLRDVVRIGRENGDIEYAAYAAHAYVHNALYAGVPLDRLREEAFEMGAFLRGFGQVNALHVHEPFERLIECFTGRAENRARLDGGGFDESRALADAMAAGSRSAQCIVRLAMGIARYHFGDKAEASAVLEEARPFLDGVASTWHVPIFHQYAALAWCGARDAGAATERVPEFVRDSLAALRALAKVSAVNFVHRLALVEAEIAGRDGLRLYEFRGLEVCAIGTRGRTQRDGTMPL